MGDFTLQNYSYFSVHICWKQAINLLVYCETKYYFRRVLIVAAATEWKPRIHCSVLPNGTAFVTIYPKFPGAAHYQVCMINNSVCHGNVSEHEVISAALVFTIHVFTNCICHNSVFYFTVYVAKKHCKCICLSAFHFIHLFILVLWLHLLYAAIPWVQLLVKYSTFPFLLPQFIAIIVSGMLCMVIHFSPACVQRTLIHNVIHILLLVCSLHVYWCIHIISSSQFCSLWLFNSHFMFSLWAVDAVLQTGIDYICWHC